jgi:hypothetical protein
MAELTFDMAASTVAQSSAVPALDAMQAALSKTTETLARELVHPGVAAPDWSESEWLVARAVSAIHGISSLLGATLRWPGPMVWTSHLRTQRMHTAKRFERIRELMQAVDARARHDGVALVALKGAALHARGLYAPGERPMADLDLLVREAHAQRAVELLEALGFRETCANWKERVFEPLETGAPASFGENSENPMRIELHTRIWEALPLRRVEISEQVFPAQPHAGLNAYPSSAALMSHLLIHAAGAMSVRAIRLINLYDVARLGQCMTTADWEQLLAPLTGEPPWWAFPPLALTARYVGSVPEWVLAMLAPRCARPLRLLSTRQSLSEVSLSHLWVSAFPGLKWAGSAREMLAYAAARLVPRHEDLAARETHARSLSGPVAGRWAHLSQAQRIVRWIIARQPRPDTLRAVRAAALS